MSDFKYVLYNTCRLENSVLIVLALIMPKKDNKLAKNVGAARCLWKVNYTRSLLAK